MTKFTGSGALVGDIELLAGDIFLDGYLMDCDLGDAIKAMFKDLAYDATYRIEFSVKGCRAAEVRFLSNGDPGYPAEYEDERVIDEVLITSGGVTKTLCHKWFKDIMTWLEDEIYDEDYEEHELY
jgi:hypothetical protein